MTHEDFQTLVTLYNDIDRGACDRAYDKARIYDSGYYNPRITNINTKGVEVTLDDNDGGSFFVDIFIDEILMSDSEWQNHLQELREQMEARKQAEKAEREAREQARRKSQYDRLKAEFEGDSK